MQFDLELPQFTPAELLACAPGLGMDTFKQWIQRQTVVMSTRDSVKRGRTPMYRGTDVIQVAAIYELTRQGMMASKAALAWQTAIQGRLIAWRSGGAMRDPPYGVGVYFWLRPETDELIPQPFSEDGDDPLNHPDAPDALMLFRTDRFILRMIERMQKVKAGKPAVEPKAELPQQSPFLGWSDLETLGKLETDDQGRKVMVGLSYEETIEYLRIVNLDMVSRLGGPMLYATDEEKWTAAEREFELEEMHQQALVRRTVTT
jgi:hypothetical protein